MKRKFLKALTFSLAFVMLATQLIVPTFAVTANDYYCSECKNDGVLGALMHTIAPTCEDGYEIHECDAEDCDGTITLRLIATGDHSSNGVLVEGYDAKCTTDGQKDYETCTVCEAKLDSTTHEKLDTIVIPALGHDYTDTVFGETCTTDGYTRYTCQRADCGFSYDDSVIPAHGHKYVKEDEVPSNCKDHGWTEYYYCDICDEEDPARSKQPLPLEDHGLTLDSFEVPTCTDGGHNTFKCNERVCPYYTGVTETLPANGHTFIFVPEKAAACNVAGNKAYNKCTVCDKIFAADADPMDVTIVEKDLLEMTIEALVHTEVSVGYKAPTCTEDGLSDAIVCDREGCNYVHHAGEVIPATGHNLTLVSANEAHCNEDGTITNGNIEHKECVTCGKMFAPAVENDDIDAVPLTNVVTTTEHTHEANTIPATCTNNGYIVYTCTKCRNTYSEIIDALGHTFDFVAEVPATCVDNGTKAHNNCTACGDNFAANAHASDITILPLTDLNIDPLGHDHSVIVNAVDPTYDAAGNTAGTKCSRCDDMLTGTVLDELNEAVNFYYGIGGINGADKAVNSGYITVDVYFDVLKDALDTYGSDVIANIFAIKYDFEYDTAAFKYVDTSFDNSFNTLNAKVNTEGKVEIVETMGLDVKPTSGKVHFATITFEVLDAAVAGVYNFNCTVVEIEHYDGEEVIAVTYVDAENVDIQAVEFEVIKLGDAKVDGKLSTADTRAFMDYFRPLFAGEDVEYETVFDMDKDGDITMTDYELLTAATVGSVEYLDKNGLTA